MASTHSMGPGNPAIAKAAEALQSRISGPIYRPGDDGYESARGLWNGAFDKHPALVAQCFGTGDVVAAVNVAREYGLPLGVRSGGHGEAGHAMADDALVVDLSRMRSIRIDPERQVAQIDTGATWNEIDAATHADGLATTGAIVSSVGVGGFTLGGGFGFLMRSCGMACDNLIAAEVVTAEGEVLRASETENPDLFWGLRGGGGNFGVVTNMEMRLHPIHTILGGMIAHPIERARDALTFYRDFMETAPDELSVYSAMMTTPDGARLIAFLVCYAGDLEAGEAVIRPLAEWGNPVMSQLGPMPYPQLQQMLDEPNPPGLPRYFRGEIFDHLDDLVIGQLVDHFDDVRSPLSAILVERLGGAAGRVPADATAYPHRDAEYSVVIVGQWMEPSDAAANIGWARSTTEAIQPYISGTYVNYLGDDGEERVRTAYGPTTYRRLAGLKAKYDPDNLFQANQNIPPDPAS